jgi:hypothetical protein|tara:strand:+ start:160 stop:954 length:795 start_codon:yes stop_codon:yes gene_type:complete
MFKSIIKGPDGSGVENIRLTPQGQPSVIDMIRELGGQKNPKQFWLRLKEAHPEVVTICDYLKFPGPGQRLTPVAKDKVAAYRILGHLPGACGDKYRADAAEQFVQALDDPAALIEKLVPRLTKEEAEWAEARLSGKRDRAVFTSSLKQAGVSQNGYGNCTNAVYVPVLKANSKTLKKHAAIKHKEETGRTIKHPVIRNYLTVDELDRLRAAESACAGQLKAVKPRLQGKPGSAVREKHVEHVVGTTARYVEALRDGTVIIPGLI